jgi:VCBS repeat-containing protein
MIPPRSGSFLGCRAGCLVTLVLLTCALPALSAESFQISPASVKLEGNFARQQLLVTASDDKGAFGERSADLTGKATYRSARPEVVTVSATGQLLAAGNGETVVTVTVAGKEHRVPVVVTGVSDKPVIGFTDQVLPVLSRAGCNAGACHAAQYGQGGFKLSVFASEPHNDHPTIARALLGRRISPVDPPRSLLLRKATGVITHGGGKRLEGALASQRSADVRLLEKWIAGGAPGPVGGVPTVTDLEVWPAHRVGSVGLPQQLRVTARYSNGKSRDVTAWAKFDTTDDGVVRVTPDGLATTVGKGLGAVMVRFEGHALLSRFVVPYSDKVDLAGWTDHNFIDRLARERFKEIGISPSPTCDDATFLRRASLDAIGTLPSVEQATTFLADSSSDKRRKLVDRLLGLTGDPAQDVFGNEYAAFWALKWSDLLKSNSTVLGEQGMWSMHNWLKDSIRRNKPFDRMVRELITARGNPYDNGPANYFVAFSGADAVAEATAQVFLGMRVMCAKCHHHPFERISRSDFQGLADFFRQVASKPSAGYGKLGGPSVILVRADDTPQQFPKTILGMPIPTDLKGGKIDRRELFADWLTSPNNPALARNIVNRYVAYLLGRGLIEPIDDLRATNAPSNPELLDALAKDFIKNKYDVKKLMRTIMTSRLYQLSSQPTASNAGDRLFYSHYLVKRVGAEPLLDAIDAVTGSPTRFPKLPLGTRAIDLPDARYENYLLTVFGKPRREGVCECERATDPNLAQALHTLNSETISAKISHPQGRLAKLLAAKKTDAEIMQDLYLAALGRRPTANEQAVLGKLRAAASDRKAFYEDLMWSLLNSKHFLFVR